MTRETTRGRVSGFRQGISRGAAMLCVLCVSFMGLSAREWDSSSRFALGIYANTGASMGGGLELGVSLYQGQVVQLRNTLSLESKAAKLLQDESFDTNILGFYEKLSLGIFGGGSISSYIGLPYFRPYLFVGAGFGLVSVRTSSFAQAPYYWEVSGGLGHEFISKSGHGAFFELGGGVARLTQALLEQRADALGGMFKVLLGYRYFF